MLSKKTLEKRRKQPVIYDLDCGEQVAIKRMSAVELVQLQTELSSHVPDKDQQDTEEEVIEANRKMIEFQRKTLFDLVVEEDGSQLFDNLDDPDLVGMDLSMISELFGMILDGKPKGK